MSLSTKDTNRLERVRYFPRQLMTAEDMRTEQAYFVERLRRHNRLLHGWGIICGLQVLPRHYHRQFFRHQVCLAFAPDSGSINEAKALAAMLDDFVDRIPGTGREEAPVRRGVPEWQRWMSFQPAPDETWPVLEQATEALGLTGLPAALRLLARWPAVLTGL